MTDRPSTSTQKHNEWLIQHFPSPTPLKKIDLTQYPSVTWSDGAALSLPRLAALLQSDRSDIASSREELLREVDSNSMNSFLQESISVLGTAGRDVDAVICDFVEMWGDRESLREFGIYSRAQFEKGKHARVIDALATLSHCRDSESAIGEIMFFLNHASTPAVKQAAMNSLSQQLRDQSLSFREIADRTVPTLGFDARGPKTVDLGSQRIRARLLADFSIELRNEKEKVIKSIPTSRKGDDVSSRDEAVRWLSSTRKQLKSFVSEQTVRLEEAMIADMQWSAATWQGRYLKRPLLFQLGRRILWTAKTNRLESGKTFRIAEDYTLADQQDDFFSLEDTMRISIAYPLGWKDDQRNDWKVIVDDYAIIPLFSQWDRQTFAPTEEEFASKGVNRFFGVRIDHRSLKSRLKRWGWTIGRFQDAFPWCLFHFRDFLPGEEALLEIRTKSLEEKTIRAICFHDRVLASTDYSQEMSVSLAHVVFAYASEMDMKDAKTTLEMLHDGSALLSVSEVPPRVFSETIRDIVRLTEHVSG